MDKQLLKDGFGWGFVLWLTGYVLSMVLFFIVPVRLLGWIITPIATIITFWVLLKKVKGGSFKYFIALSIIWTLLAIVLDYLFIVKALKPAAGYYKLDVYLYYVLTFIYPLLVAIWKKNWRQRETIE